jgi:hypothetical protein
MDSMTMEIVIIIISHIVFWTFIVAMIVGLVNPERVLKWSAEKTRPRVVHIYGLAALATFVISNIIRLV